MVHHPLACEQSTGVHAGTDVCLCPSRSSEMIARMFLGEPPHDEQVDAAFAKDRAADGYVHNYTRLWAWRPGLWDSFQDLRDELTGGWSLTDREKGILVAAAVSQREDSYCSLAWTGRLNDLLGVEATVDLLAGRPAPALSERERALADWARQVVRDPNATSAEDVARLREVGFGDREIFEATAWVAFRLALSTVNDALGAGPDVELAETAPPEVREIVTYGRAPSG